MSTVSPGIPRFPAIPCPRTVTAASQTLPTQGGCTAASMTLESTSPQMASTSVLLLVQQSEPFRHWIGWKARWSPGALRHVAGEMIAKEAEVLVLGSFFLRISCSWQTGSWFLQGGSVTVICSWKQAPCKSTIQVEQPDARKNKLFCQEDTCPLSALDRKSVV